MTDINGAQVTELAVRLQKFFVHQQQVSGCDVENLEDVLHDACDLQTTWTAQGFACPAQQLEDVLDEIRRIRFSCNTGRDTAALAEQDLTQLLALVGVDLGELRDA